MRIESVVLHEYPMASSWLTGTVIANPMSWYPEYRESRNSWYGAMTAGVIELQTTNGVAGYGFVGSGKASASREVLNSQFAELLVGRELFAHQQIRDILDRSRWHFGRSGITSSLISGIDLALWDAKGKVLRRPVYSLLGGPTRRALRPYLTTLDPLQAADIGFSNIKIAMQYGPADGPSGMRKNLELVHKAREAVGPDGVVAVDCYMAWDVDYTIRMERAFTNYDVAWIEEPVAPTDFDGYRQISESVSTPISGGEHLYELRDFLRLITVGGVRLVQPDLYRLGGITAALDVAAIARTYGVKLMCHGIGLPSYHFLMALEPSLAPLCEYIDIESSSPVSWIFPDDPRPIGGQLEIAETPGFGYGLRNGLAPGDAVAPIW